MSTLEIPAFITAGINVKQGFKIKGLHGGMCNCVEKSLTVPLLLGVLEFIFNENL